MFSTRYDREAKEWHGRHVLPLFNPKISVAQVLLDSMTMFGPKVAQISDNNGIQLTFDDIRVKTIRAAQNLQSRGYEPKQVFAVMEKNSHNLAPIVFASISIGCPLNTLDPSFGKTEIIHMLGTTKPVLMFCDVTSYDLVKECLSELKNDAKIITFGGSKGDSESVENLFAETHNEDNFSPVNVDGVNDTALIICSSGTSGYQYFFVIKSVCVSHAALTDGSIRLFDITSDDVMLGFSTLYWISGILILINGTLRGVTRIITTEAFTPELQLRLIERYKVSFTLNATHHINLILNSELIGAIDLSSLKSAMVGGGKVPFHIQTEMKKYLPNGNIHVAYGMTEAGGPITVEYPETSARDVVGRLADGLCVKIIDDDENRCGVNEDGEVCFKTHYRFLGYYNNQSATDDVFDDEGFVLTGDFGHFDDDGYLHIVDRKKDIFKYNNYPIAPSAIEALLITSPKIKSVCVVGIFKSGTELPAAVIVRANQSEIDESEVFDMVADHFADYYKLRGGVYFVDSLPTTVSGKILRRTVLEIATTQYNTQN